MGFEDAVYLAKLAEQAERYEGTYPPPAALPDRRCGGALIADPARLVQRWSTT